MCAWCTVTKLVYISRYSDAVTVRRRKIVRHEMHFLITVSVHLPVRLSVGLWPGSPKLWMDLNEILVNAFHRENWFWAARPWESFWGVNPIRALLYTVCRRIVKVDTICQRREKILGVIRPNGAGNCGGSSCWDWSVGVGDMISNEFYILLLPWHCQIKEACMQHFAPLSRINRRKCSYSETSSTV